jgi:hypothetical protein
VRISAGAATRRFCPLPVEMSTPAAFAGLARSVNGAVDGVKPPHPDRAVNGLNLAPTD